MSDDVTWTVQLHVDKETLDRLRNEAEKRNVSTSEIASELVENEFGDPEENL